MILQKEIYATAALAGAVILWLAMPVIGRVPGSVLAFVIIFIVRVICHHKGVHLTLKKLVARPDGDSKSGLI